MHMADALLSPQVGGAMYALSAGAAVLAAKKTGEETEEKLPLMAVSGAFVFAAQMINFSIPATGSSGHIGGGILLAGLLGGGPAYLALAAVLIIQCLFFADGGLLALGANLFNMGVIPCLLVYPLLFRPLVSRGASAARLTAASLLSCVVTLQLGAFGVVLETTASGVTELPFGAFLLLMQPIHLAIGLAEGAATAAVLNYVRTVRPEMFENAPARAQRPEGSLRRVILTLAVLALLTAGGLSLFASGSPDGLEWSVERTAGTPELTREGAVYEAAESFREKTALFPDYDFAEGNGTGTSAAGVTGALLTCALAGGAGLLIFAAKKRGRKTREA